MTPFVCNQIKQGVAKIRIWGQDPWTKPPYRSPSSSLSRKVAADAAKAPEDTAKAKAAAAAADAARAAADSAKAAKAAAADAAKVAADAVKTAVYTVNVRDNGQEARPRRGPGRGVWRILGTMLMLVFIAKTLGLLGAVESAVALAEEAAGV